MLDHFPTQFEIAMARQDWQMGHATCEQMEILRFADPMMNYGGDCDCATGGLLDCLVGPGWPW